MKTVMFILLVMLQSSNVFADVYKWRDEKGVLHFSNDSTSAPEHAEQFQFTYLPPVIPAKVRPPDPIETISDKKKVEDAYADAQKTISAFRGVLGYLNGNMGKYDDMITKGSTVCYEVEGDEKCRFGNYSGKGGINSKLEGCCNIICG